MNKLKKRNMLVPTKPPYELTWEYLQSKDATRQMIKLFDCGDYIRDANVRTSNYFARQKLMNTEKLLESRRSLAARRRTELDEQWEDLQKRENELRQMFMKFNEFVIENSDKRTRTDQRIAEQKLVWEQRQKQIENTLNECDKIEKIKQRMSKKLVTYKLYEDFLNSMVEMFPTDFSNILDIINRYDVIKHTSQTLSEHQSIELHQLEISKRELMKIIEEKNLVIMGLNNQIASLQARFEHANIKSLECEQLVTRIKNNAVRIMNEMDEVKSSIWNVYVHMAHSKKHPVKIKKENVEEQALYIKRTLTELSKINNILRKPAKLAKMKLKAT